MMQAAPQAATWLTLLLSILLPMAIGMGIMASQPPRTSRSHVGPKPSLPHISMEPDVTPLSLGKQARYHHLNFLARLLCPQGFDHIVVHNVNDHQYVLMPCSDVSLIQKRILIDWNMTGKQVWPLLQETRACWSHPKQEYVACRQTASIQSCRRQPKTSVLLQERTPLATVTLVKESSDMPSLTADTIPWVRRGSVPDQSKQKPEPLSLAGPNAIDQVRDLPADVYEQRS